MDRRIRNYRRVLAPHPKKKKVPCLHRRNHECSCVSYVPYFKLLLECLNRYAEVLTITSIDLRLLNTGHLFLWGGWGGGYIAVL